MSGNGVDHLSVPTSALLSPSTDQLVVPATPDPRSPNTDQAALPTSARSRQNRGQLAVPTSARRSSRTGQLSVPNSARTPRSRLHSRQSRVAPPSEKTHTTRATYGDTELADYDWLDLPPIGQMKSAIARQRISHGISYLLPVDKGRNSVNSVFRTNLRAMFQEPYLNNHADYDESIVRASAKHHFQPNTVPSKFKKEYVDPSEYKLSAETEKIRSQYAKSAPTSSMDKHKQSADSLQIKSRSNLFLPLKTNAPEEPSAFQLEVQRIMKDSHQNDEDEDENGVEKRHVNPRLIDTHRASQVKKFLNEFKDKERATKESNRKLMSEQFKQFENYTDFKRLKLPKKPVLPITLKSPYLAGKQNERVWDWLTYDEVITDHKYFLTMCG